jgi:hypothetical protein
MNESPWALQALMNQGSMGQGQGLPPLSPDQSYPSFPNSAGLGNQMGWDKPPPTVPVPAYEAPQMLDPNGMPVSPWSLMQMGQNNGY